MVMMYFVVFVNDFHEWKQFVVVVVKEVTKVVVNLHFC